MLLAKILTVGTKTSSTLAAMKTAVTPINYKSSGPYRQGTTSKNLSVKDSAM